MIFHREITVESDKNNEEKCKKESWGGEVKFDGVLVVIIGLL